MRVRLSVLLGLLCLYADGRVSAAPPKLTAYFPPTEAEGGWRTLLPEKGDPDSSAKSKIRDVAGVDWNKLEAAWIHNADAPGATGLLVIRRGHVVGEWYRDGDRNTDFLIYSSSKSYTSTAFGLILDDFGNGPLPSGKRLTLDTKVCNEEWIPDSIPLSDPRKAEITVRHLLNMTSGVGPAAVPRVKPFEFSLGHLEGAPTATLEGTPGTVFHYSNAGVAHLVLLFNKATGTDLYPFLKARLLDPIGEKQVRWEKIGGGGAIGPYSQGYSGIFTTPREHARYCYLALHKGEWDGRRIVPESYYDFAWTGTKVSPQYGGQWWTAANMPGTPSDLVMTKGRDCNDGFVIPSLDLVVVRLGNGNKFPKDFEKDLITKVVDAVAQ
jgi:CubicO group peptidase (beta-lactamase class C family)